MGSEKRTVERKPVITSVEFYVDADIIQATSVDLSEGGIRFTTSKPILVRMRFEVDGRQEEREAQLVWAGRNESDTMDYGLQYVEDPEEYQGDPEE